VFKLKTKLYDKAYFSTAFTAILSSENKSIDWLKECTNHSFLKIHLTNLSKVISLNHISKSTPPALFTVTLNNLN